MSDDLQSAASLARILSEMKSVLELDGDAAEFGVFQGRTARRMGALLARGRATKTLHLFDSFHGNPAPDLAGGDKGAWDCGGWYAAKREDVERALCPLRNFIIHEGLFCTRHRFQSPLCFAHIDCDLYQSTQDAIGIAGPNLVSGGKLVFHDYTARDWPGVRMAVDELLLPEHWDLQVFDETEQCVARKKG